MHSETWLHLLSSGDAYILFAFVFSRGEHCQSRDGRSGDMAMTSTSRAIALRKRCVSSNLDKLTHDFLGDISSTDSEGNFYSWDFSMESKSA